MSGWGGALQTMMWLTLFGLPIAYAGPQQHRIPTDNECRYITLDLIPPLGVDLPPAYRTAEKIFDRASDSYRAGRYGQAADGFMAAAWALQGADTEDDASGAVGNREICYQNAVYAFKSAKDETCGKDFDWQIFVAGSAPRSATHRRIHPTFC